MPSHRLGHLELQIARVTGECVSAASDALAATFTGGPTGSSTTGRRYPATNIQVTAPTKNATQTATTKKIFCFMD